MRKCIVYKTSMRDDVSYRGRFHGFFQSGQGEVGGFFEIEPVAIVERPNGRMYEVAMRFFSFDNNEDALVLLDSIPKYKAHEAKRCLN